MATFHIHQDVVEKENQILKKDKSKVLQPQQQKRATFAVLNSNTVNAGGNGKPNFRDAKRLANVVSAKVIDENFGVANVAKCGGRKVATTASVVPLEQFKTFSVYEDKSLTDACNVSVCSEIDDSLVGADISNGAIRNPLRDISHRGDSIQHETPMSIGGVLSPMSIDKSQLDSALKSKSELGVLPRNDRERFFEVVEYQHAILSYFREVEKKHRPKANYMKRQPDINYSMRTILVDWLVEVAEEYRLDTETLYLAINYIDRFLSFMSVVRAKLQLVGTAAMYIASKYEEIYPPDVGEFVFITDDTYTKTQVLRMEQIVLKMLSFDLCVPSNYAFINTYAVLHDMPDQLKFLAQYISELSLLEADPYLQFFPSQISAASIALGRYLLGMTIWSAEMEEITTYSIDSLREIVVHLNRSHIAAVALAQQAIQDKYKSNKYLEVSTIKPIPTSAEEFEEIFSDYNAKAEAAKETSKLNTTNNENVRKMISSLMFV